MTFRPKLVRDRIPDIIREAGKSCECAVMDDDEYTQRLLDKLHEEIEEFVEDPCVEEAADIYEVFLAMLSNNCLGSDEVLAVADAKRLTHGGFNRKILLKKIGNECNL